MRPVAYALAGLAIGWAMKTGGSDAWVAVSAAALFGFLVAVIVLSADVVIRLYGPSR